MLNLKAAKSISNTDDNASNAMNCDLHEYLPDDLLVKEDRASMAVTLEARVPLIDHELAEFAARIPSNYKIRNKQTKYILKKVLRRNSAA